MVTSSAFVSWAGRSWRGAILVAIWWHDRRKLVPRQQQLEQLLRDYETRA